MVNISHLIFSKKKIKFKRKFKFIKNFFAMSLKIELNIRSDMIRSLYCH